MSITLLRLKPDNDATLSRTVSTQLAERASAAGKQLAVRQCGRLADAMDCLQRATDLDTEFVLFDPGDACGEAHELRELLGNASFPFVEVHDDHFGALESPLHANADECVAVVQGYGPQGYSLALSIALEHLGCAEAENPLHVGT